MNRAIGVGVALLTLLALSAPVAASQRPIVLEFEPAEIDRLAGRVTRGRRRPHRRSLVMMYQAARVLIAFAVVSVAMACAGPQEASPSASEAARATATPEPTSSPDPIAAILEQCADAPESEGETVALTLGASTEGFDTDRLEGPRHCEPFTITLRSTGTSAEHNVAIEPMDRIGLHLFAGELIGREETITYEIPPLPAGEYRFLCIPHRQFMQGILVVAPSG